VAFVGKTGSGKSTALQLLDALVAPRVGTARAFGADLGAKSTDIRGIRMRAPLAVQRPESALFELYSADDVAFGPRNLGLSGKALVERVRRSMEEAGLGYDEFRDRRTRSLSGGEKRRLALAGVLAMGGEALLLDEPTSALDPATKKSILGLILEKARSGTTVVMATHSMDEAAAADIVVVFSEGRIVALGDPRTIFYDRYESAWGIGRPFAVETAAALESSGAAFRRRPLSVADLAEELS
jgi:energy-coupling factor transport system ATP-binding protein